MTGPEPVKCATHPDVLTNLRCGKCGKPICPKCMVQTPVGARCRECARLYKLPTFQVSGQYYLRAAGTALGLAVVIGLLWGFIEAVLPSYFFSLILAIGIGWVIGELVSLAVNRKRSSGLAVVGGAGVALCYGVAYLMEYLRAGFVSFDFYRIAFTLVAIGIGVYFAVNRLR
ncbi:MAG: B-box zinc finger protein [Dehalococcoidales bacterium]